MRFRNRSFWILPVIVMIFIAFGLFAAGAAVRLVILLYGHPPHYEVKHNG